MGGGKIQNPNMGWWGDPKISNSGKPLLPQGLRVKKKSPVGGSAGSHRGGAGQWELGLWKWYCHGQRCHCPQRCHQRQEGTWRYCGFSPLPHFSLPQGTPLPKPIGRQLAREPGKGRSLQYRAGQRRARNGAEKRDQFWPIAHGPSTTMWQSQVGKQGALESISLGEATREMRGGQNSRWKK